MKVAVVVVALAVREDICVCLSVYLSVCLRVVSRPISVTICSQSEKQNSVRGGDETPPAGTLRLVPHCPGVCRIALVSSGFRPGSEERRGMGVPGIGVTGVACQLDLTWKEEEEEERESIKEVDHYVSLYCASGRKRRRRRRGRMGEFLSEDCYPRLPSSFWRVLPAGRLGKTRRLLGVRYGWIRFLGSHRGGLSCSGSHASPSSRLAVSGLPPAGGGRRGPRCVIIMGGGCGSMKSSFADQYGWTNQMVCVVPISCRRPPAHQLRQAARRLLLLLLTWLASHKMAQ
ncbi:hypothetical protein E2C01_038203 [Portunus trituberculatus]|uniref:Uncharacterized protein n=1 Tax=Portunus trituberculatus TaxID=210409 RepID=A0A5B7FGY1_PORTR|nr:hypothetical protein [Portunus trituberculatus]